MLSTVLALVAVEGLLTQWDAGAAAAVAGALALSAVILSLRPSYGVRELTGLRFRWVAAAWAFVIIQPIGHFTSGRTALTAVSGTPSVENVLELSSNALIAALVLWSMTRNQLGRRPAWVLLALPVLALLSAAWSLATNVTLGFSFELIVITLLAALTEAIITADEDAGRSLVRQTLRFTVYGVTALCLIGLVIHSGWRLPGEVPRFTWPGTHPLLAAAEVGAALLIVLFAGRRDLEWPWPVRFLLLGLFATCLYLGQSRTALAGLVVAALFGYWLGVRHTGVARQLAGAVVIAAVVAVLIGTFGGALTHYLYRGQSEQQVLALNGRLGLWKLTLQQLHSPGRWLFGYGLSGSRVLLANSVAWAGDAHGAWVELLLSLGLVGITVGVMLVLTLGVRLLRASAGFPFSSRVLAILFVYLVAMSPAATGFAAPGPEPGMAFALLGFCYAASRRRAREPARVVVARWPPVEAGLQPLPA